MSEPVLIEPYDGREGRTPQERLHHGMHVMDETKVLNALAEGGDPNFGEPPTWAALTDFNDGRDDARRAGILRLVLPRVDTTLNLTQYPPYMSFADHAFSLKNSKSASLIVMRALQQAQDSGRRYTPDFDALFSEVGDEVDWFHPDRIELRDKAHAVLNAVAGTIAAPKHPFETQIVYGLDDEIKAYWSVPKRLDLAKLAHPSAEFSAIRRSELALINRTNVLVIGGPPDSPDSSTRFLEVFTRLQSTKDELRLNGRASVVPERLGL